jgi:outer membrane protein insertion porin family
LHFWQLRGALLTTLTALTLAAVCAGESGVRLPGQDASQSEASPAQPQIPGLDNMAKYQGQLVEEIRWPNVVSATDRTRFGQLISQKQGASFDRDLIRQSIRELYATGRFADIRVEVDKTAEGRLSLLFVTTPNYFIGEVRVEGTVRRPTPGQIINASKLSLGDLFTNDQMDRAQANIKQLAEENGFYHSVTTPEEKPDPETQQMAIVFHFNPGPQARVGTVVANCDPACSQPEILKIAKFHPGDLASSVRASDALDRLRKKYQKQNRLLSQVLIAKKSYRADANAVDYTLQITPGPKVMIEAEGFKVKQRVLKKNVPVFEENAVDEDLLNEGRQNLLNYLQSRGYFDAKVTMKQLSDNPKDALHIIYVIEAGARHKLVKVEIAGNQYFKTEDLRPRLQVQPASRLFAQGRFTQGLLTNDIHGLENLYKTNGFQQVKITSTQMDDYEGRENEIAIKLAIEEGPQTRVGVFHLVGNKSFSQSQLFPAVIQTAAGQPFSEAYISQDRDNLLNFYFNHGFPQATFEAVANPIPDQADRMDVTFTIQEGEQVFVNRVLVSGLDHTKRYVVNRELQVASGDPLSQIDMLQSQQRLYDLGIFSQVDTAVQNPNGTESQKDVLIDAQEAKRYTFLYGIGLEFQTGQPTAIGTNQAKGETGVSPRVSLNITRLNFRGRNHTITFKADFGSLQKRGLVSYVAPRLFGSPKWKLTFNALYDDTLDVTTFTSQRLEGSVQADQRINKTSTMDYGFTYRRVKASNIQISPAEVPLLSLPVRVGEPVLSYIRNTRDNDLETTKGMYIAANAGVASNVFGSEADFSRLLIQNSTYHAFGKNRPRERKFVFARSTTVGVENAFGDTAILPPGQRCPGEFQTSCVGVTVIPLAERFLSGGGNSLRGFGLNQAGPRDPVTGFPLGGSALIINNSELRLPPVSLPYVHDNMSFVLFEDAGNVFTDGRNMLDSLLQWRQKDPSICLQAGPNTEHCDFSYISNAVGVGVRYKTPIGPVRFDFGYNLNPPAFPSCQDKASFTGQMPSPYCVTNSTSNGQATLPYFVPQHVSHFNVYFSIGQSF